MPQHRSGGKFTSGHTTLTDDAATFVDAAVKLAEVTKISLGRMERVSSKVRRLRFKDTQAGWEVTVHGTASMQTIHVYIAQEDKTKVRGNLEKVFA